MAKFRFRLWHLIPLSIPVIYMMTDYSVNAADIASSYMSQETKGVESNKAAFIVQYRQAVEAKANAGKFDPVEGIDISADIFTDTCIRLNTEAYQISKEELDKWRDTVTDEGGALYKGYVEFMSPLIPIATTIGEMGWASVPVKGGMNMMDVSIMWTPVVYTNLVECYIPDMDWSQVQVGDVDTAFYLDKGIDCVDDCGNNCNAEDESKGHGAYWHDNGNNQSSFTDNDSLGPLQILRRYLGIGNDGAPGQIVYASGTVSDLLRWRDNSVYFYNNEGNKMKESSNALLYDRAINNVYQLVVLTAIAHNTGGGFLVTSDSNYQPSFWKNADAIYNYSYNLTTDSSIVVLREIVDKWYEESVAGDEKGKNSFNLIGGEYAEGYPAQRQNGRDLLMKLGMDEKDYLIYSSKMGQQVQWGMYLFHEENGKRVVDLDAHKSLYGLKTLLNYMCLEKLYQSGMQ